MVKIPLYPDVAKRSHRTSLALPSATKETILWRPALSKHTTAVRLSTLQDCSATDRLMGEDQERRKHAMMKKRRSYKKRRT